jgi:hypothetical protein
MLPAWFHGSAGELLPTTAVSGLFFFDDFVAQEIVTSAVAPQSKPTKREEGKGFNLGNGLL